MPPQPDFSGRWTLVVALPSDARVADALDVRQTVTRMTIRGEPMPPYFSRIETVRTFAADTTTETHLIGVIGGTVGGIVNAKGSARPTPPSVNSRFEVKWNGATLAFELGTYTGDSWQPRDWTERRETWALQPNGELAIDIATRSSTDRPRAVSAIYRRRD